MLKVLNLVTNATDGIALVLAGGNVNANKRIKIP